MNFSTARKDQGQTIASIAKQAQMSPLTVKAVEHGKGSISSMLSVLDALDLQITWKGISTGPLGTALAKVRRERKISQRKMASMINVSQPTVIALEVRNTGRMTTLKSYMTALGIKGVLTPKSTKPRLIPVKNKPTADKVYTPRQLAGQVINNFPLSGTVLDPCRGNGAFFDQLPSDIESFWCEIDQGRDFLDWSEHIDWVISNPPWSKMREFLNHGMTVADNVCYLAAFTHFTTKARVRDIAAHGFAMRSILYVPTPKEWPQSGFQMAAVWLQRGWAGPCQVQQL